MVKARTSPWLNTVVLVTSRLALGSAVAFTAYEALAPHTRVITLLPWDKAEHFVAFATLTGLALLALPRTSVFGLAISLSLVGAVVELVQATPWVHRDAELGDWVAETLAIAGVLGVQLIAHLRAGLRTPTRPASERVVSAPLIASASPAVDPRTETELRREVTNLRELLNDLHNERERERAAARDPVRPPPSPPHGGPISEAFSPPSDR